jgi:hypothetical protein
LVIRRDNPEDGGRGQLVAAPTDPARRPSYALSSFLRYSLRDPILRMVKP